MVGDETYKSEKECVDILRFIFKDALQFYNKIAPNGLRNTDYILLLHPIPEQQYKEHIRMRENINLLSKNSRKDDKEIKVSDFKQDDLTDIQEFNEVLYILWTCGL